MEYDMNYTNYICFTSKMTRLINCFNGFVNHIVINISNN